MTMPPLLTPPPRIFLKTVKIKIPLTYIVPPRHPNIIETKDALDIFFKDSQNKYPPPPKKKKSEDSF